MPIRRQFIATSAVTAANHAFAAPKDENIKIALIGCGGRGTGGCNKSLSADSTIKLVAVVDPLEGRARNTLELLKAKHEGQVLTFAQALQSQERLVPDNTKWNTEPPVKPDADGWYPVAIPGTTLPA